MIAGRQLWTCFTRASELDWCVGRFPPETTGRTSLAAFCKFGGGAGRGEERVLIVLASNTDPGNADAVITVGATYRRRAERHGMSYFLPGPTGGERTTCQTLRPRWGDQQVVPQKRERE